MTPQEEEDLIQQNLKRYSKTQTDVNKNYREVSNAPAKQSWETQVSPTTAAMRGLGSGLLMGFQPQVAGALSAINPFTDETYAQGRDLAAARNEAAWQQNPGAYASGYTVGAVAPMLSGVGELGAGTKAAVEGYQLMKPTMSAAEYAVKAAPAVAQRVGSKVAATTAERVAAPVKETIRKSIPEAAGRVYGGSVNQQPNAPLVPYSVNPLDPRFGVPLSQNEEEPAPFSALTNFLAQARESDNPEVKLAAVQAQAAVDPNDPDAKRKIAMMLQSTPAGRAVGNGDSDLNEVA